MTPALDAMIAVGFAVYVFVAAGTFWGLVGNRNMHGYTTVSKRIAAAIWPILLFVRIGNWIGND